MVLLKLNFTDSGNINHSLPPPSPAAYLQVPGDESLFEDRGNTTERKEERKYDHES
jgi:hypothetical protein